MVTWHKVPQGEYRLPSETSLAGLIVVGLDFRATVAEVATATTLTENHYLVLVNGNVTITLPKAILHKGRVYTIKNIGQGIVTIDANSGEKIDGAGTLALNLQYGYVTIVSDADEWFIIGGRNVKLEDLFEKLLTEVIAKLGDLLIESKQQTLHQASQSDEPISESDVDA